MNNSIVEQYYLIIKNKISQASFEAAMRSIDKLIYHFPQNAEGYYYKGVCNFALEKYEDAFKFYKKAIEINSIHAKAYFNLGVCYYVYNKYDHALINIGKALIIFSKQKESDCKERCIEALKLIKMERNA